MHLSFHAPSLHLRCTPTASPQGTGVGVVQCNASSLHRRVPGVSASLCTPHVLSRCPLRECNVGPSASSPHRITPSHYVNLFFTCTYTSGPLRCKCKEDVQSAVRHALHPRTLCYPTVTSKRSVWGKRCGIVQCKDGTALERCT